MSPVLKYISAVGLSVLSLALGPTGFAQNSNVPAPAPATAAKPAFQPRPALPAQPADPPPVKASIQLNELFSVESNPGAGALEYGKGKPVQTVRFGSTDGHYAMGVLFPGKALPTQVAKDLGSRSVLQIVFGTLRTKLTTEVPQFAAASIFLEQLRNQPKTFPVLIPDPKASKARNFGLFLFTEPNTAAEMNDEEKLKRTFFGQKGSLTAQLIGTKKTIEIQNREKKVPFHVQVLKLEVNVTTGTPFNPEEFPIRGKVELPVYWPGDKRGMELMRQIAKDSFAVSAGLQTEKDPADKAIAPLKNGKK